MNVQVNEEVTKDPVFLAQVDGIIAELTAAKEKAERESERGLKSSPLLKLMNEGKFTRAFILAEFPKVAAKQSTLPAGQRDIVGSVVFQAAQRTVIFKNAQRAEEIARKANARVAAEEAREEAAP